MQPEDFGGVTADEAIRRVLEVQWQGKAIAAVTQYRVDEPERWSEYIREQMIAF
ncbi:hypothetical protein [Catelliglobosispora koreensis]|uniref:hypothetical protein n=1 Tax=Catelliglobosispora koreensis TaxID=129052 RepID=UPI00036ED999|nr:hypothetical protein [Catelliglobosispora koreensis]